MNKEETLALWAQGKGAWNAWANDMLDQHAEMEKAHGIKRPSSDAMSDWIANAGADFGGHMFDEDVDFELIVFPGQANFIKAVFQKVARFWGAEFRANAVFLGTIFSGDAWFHGATFAGAARFA